MRRWGKSPVMMTGPSASENASDNTGEGRIFSPSVMHSMSPKMTGSGRMEGGEPLSHCWLVCRSSPNSTSN